MTDTRTLSARHETVHEGIPGRAERHPAGDVGLWAGLAAGGPRGPRRDERTEDRVVALSAVEHTDAYGNPVPSYEDILDEIGAPGSVANAEHYAQTFGEWDVEMDDDDEEAR